jgi:hypothetical protein
MFKKIAITCAFALQALVPCVAQTSAPASAAAGNNHKSYDQKARECRKQAASQQLSAEDTRSFVARCMKQ